MREELGTSFSTWLARARMLRATELLADPDAAVGDVALRCGFQSPAAFSRAFQLHLGRPPSAWRRG
jgi:transcriptional regulator GlxA family with amidase domain